MKILGVSVDNVSLDESCLRTKELIENSNKTCKMIFAPNTEIIMCAQKDKEFFEILNGIKKSFAKKILNPSFSIKKEYSALQFIEINPAKFKKTF